jgi:hypothetical protein
VAGVLDGAWSIVRQQLGLDLVDENGQPRVVCAYRAFVITRPVMLCLQKKKELTGEVGPILASL